MSRERDVRSAIQAKLLATGAFSDVWLTGLPDNYGQGSSDITAASIEPVATSMKTGWDTTPDGGLYFSTALTVTILARHSDPQLRDELAEQLLSNLINCVAGQSLADFTLPVLTLVNAWQWKPPTPPERRIVANVSFGYLIEGWDNFDVSN